MVDGKITSNDKEIIIEGKRISFTSIMNYLGVLWNKSSVDLALNVHGKLISKKNYLSILGMYLDDYSLYLFQEL